ncbi:galactose mutarotase-like [Clytia hemisphaerica]
MKKLEISNFGILPSGEIVKKIEFENKNGLKFSVLNYGATAASLICPDKNGKSDDIILGYNNLEGYLENSYFGSTIGRFTNRICKGKFSLDGTDYQLNCNNGSNHLHGGCQGWDKKLWDWKIETDEVEFHLESKDGDECYPGNVNASVCYKLTEDNEVQIRLKATTDQTTLINMTNHAFFNLSGQEKNTKVLDHEMLINSSKYLPVDSTLIPTGEVKDLSKDPVFDFRTKKIIGQDIEEAGGYDHNYCFDDQNDDFRARVFHENSGRQLEIRSSQPGMQFYSGNFLNGHIGKLNNKYDKHCGFALEPQFYPDNINQPSFTSSITKSGETYEQYIIWKISVKN